MERVSILEELFLFSNAFGRIRLHKFSFPAGPQLPSGAESTSRLIRWRTFNWVHLQSAPSDSSLNVIYARGFLKVAFNLFTEHQSVITRWP